MTKETWFPALWSEHKENGHPFNALRRQMDELIDSWAGGMPGVTGSQRADSFAPRIEVSETDREIRITAELPGVEQQDIDVTLAGNQLTIKGEKKSNVDEKKEDKGRVYHRVERSYGGFLRTMSVPDGLDPAKVDASFKDGVLTLCLTKSPEAQQQTRKIEIKKVA